MENTLDRMVERIYHEGISRAEDRAASIVAEAQKQALETTGQAKSEAAQIVAEARREAQNIKRSAQAELSSLAQHALAQLKLDIRTLLVRHAVAEPLKTALSDVQFIKNLFLKLAENTSQQAFVVTVPDSMRAELAAQLAAALHGKLPGLEIRGGERKSGFVVAAAGADYEIEFTEAALTEFLEPYMRKATSELFKGPNGQG